MALEEALGHPIARYTAEILRPVPIADLAIDVEVVRPGRTVRLGAGTLSDDEGPVLMARAWALRHEHLELPVEVQPSGAELASPEEYDTAPFFPVPWDEGYHTAMEVRFASGGFVELGPATAWMRMRVPLVAGEPITPLSRVLVGADSGNGLSASLDFERWLFINTDLTVHLHRQPDGEWVRFDAKTVAEPHGVGLATTTITDQRGALGHGLQTLLVAQR